MKAKTMFTVLGELPARRLTVWPSLWLEKRNKTAFTILRSSLGNLWTRHLFLKNSVLFQATIRGAIRGLKGNVANFIVKTHRITAGEEAEQTEWVELISVFSCIVCQFSPLLVIMNELIFIRHFEVPLLFRESQISSNS